MFYNLSLKVSDYNRYAFSFQCVVSLDAKKARTKQGRGKDGEDSQMMKKRKNDSNYD